MKGGNLLARSQNKRPLGSDHYIISRYMLGTPPTLELLDNSYSIVIYICIYVAVNMTPNKDRYRAGAVPKL